MKLQTYSILIFSGAEMLNKAQVGINNANPQATLHIRYDSEKPISRQELIIPNLLLYFSGS
ncbi:hypothetical protein [Chryseobacterium sp. NFX27]|jgi:hypothetical protein|uniref:hypothetical protein n=1 Tax=Chryseobacterium sp. NFX27 TaxID=2819618 RepID=UPI003CE68F0C